MKQLISCEFNIDTACVELYFTDESRISIDCTAVENEVADNRFQRSELVDLQYFWNWFEGGRSSKICVCT